MTRFVGIDPSTKTGICILDTNGNVLDAYEIEKEGKDPERMASIIDETISNVEHGDVVAIEGFGFGSGSGFILGGIGWGMRMELYNRNINYLEVAPSALKKFASGKGNINKDVLAVEIFKRWEYEHASDNVRDAFVLAQIARAARMGTSTTQFQKDVIQTILAPPEEKAEKKSKKRKKKA
ncbi:hypothetical protein [Paenibacillus massiliensis]|uniref:hypothetical protein n=1 Tax=Paenibacillus massiliensis TaxID=225917 RepID=UPI000425EE28|nr:hypothetical protein [Paenibacillus massiliensis]